MQVARGYSTASPGPQPLGSLGVLAPQPISHGHWETRGRTAPAPTGAHCKIRAQVVGGASPGQDLKMLTCASPDLTLQSPAGPPWTPWLVGRSSAAAWGWDGGALCLVGGGGAVL